MAHNGSDKDMRFPGSRFPVKHSSLAIVPVCWGRAPEKAPGAINKNIQEVGQPRKRGPRLRLASDERAVDQVVPGQRGRN